MLDTIKGGMKTKFYWNPHENNGFKTLKKRIATHPILFLPSFDKLFTMECDASNVEIGKVLSQEERPKDFHSEKINDAKKK